MSEETVTYFERARQSGVSSIEAWKDLDALAGKVTWDVDHMLCEEKNTADSPSERETQR